MHTLVIAFGVLLLIMAVFLLPWPWRLLEISLHNYERLAPGRFRTLIQFVERDHPTIADANFWLESGGCQGIMARMADTTAIVHVLQAYVDAEKVSELDALEVYQLALAQRWVSVAALVASMFCRKIPVVPHALAKLALQLNWQLSLRAINLCRDGDDGFQQALFL